jgi:hypothetical protein
VGQARFVFNVTCLPGIGASTTSMVCWRLLSPNNRQLGRSAGVFHDLPSGRRAVDELLRSLSAAEPSLTRQGGSGGWLWRIISANEVIATSGRSFETRRQALRTVQNFLVTAPLATVTSELMNLPPARRESLDDTVKTGGS